MSKVKDTVEEFKNKYLNVKKEEVVKEEVKAKAATMDNVTYDVIQDPSTKSRAFLIVKIKYDLKTKEAIIEEVRNFNDKVAGMSMVADKDNREFLFKRNRSRK